jgi:glycosyltransferase involved in cell wall biosynthesis
MGQIQRHSIFIGNASSPRKGAHFVLHALAQLKQEYPDLKLYIAGLPPVRGARTRWKNLIGYPAYLRQLIETLGLSAHVEFTGVVDAERMAQLMCNAHLLVMASVIENSPNTLGEAMILGLPVVSAYTGGAPDMAQPGEEALFYRDDDPQVLAFQIKRIFDDDDLALRLSKSAQRRALKTHDPDDNLGKMLAIYGGILQRADRQQLPNRRSEEFSQ